MASSSTLSVLQTSEAWRKRRFRQQQIVDGVHQNVHKGERGAPLLREGTVKRPTETWGRADSPPQTFRPNLLAEFLLPNALLQKGIPPLRARRSSPTPAAAPRQHADPQVAAMMGIFTSPQYREHSHLAFQLSAFFRSQVDHKDPARTGRAFDLLFTLGVATTGHVFHEDEEALRESSAWRHAVHAGIVPGTLRNANRLHGHLFGVGLLPMVRAFVAPRLRFAWPDAATKKALGCVLFFLASEEGGAPSYDMDLLGGVPPNVLFYFLEWSLSTDRNVHPHSARLEKQLALLWAHAMEMARDPHGAVAHPLTGMGLLDDEDGVGQCTRRLVGVFRRLSSPDAQGVIFYYIMLGVLHQHAGDAPVPGGLLAEFGEKGGMLAWHDALVLGTGARFHAWQRGVAGVSTAKCPLDDVLAPKVCRVRKVPVVEAKRWLKVCRALDSYVGAPQAPQTPGLQKAYWTARKKFVSNESSKTEELIQLAKELGVQDYAGPYEQPDCPHLLYRAHFGRLALGQLREESKETYLAILNAAVEEARANDQDVTDTAVELMLSH